jgi:hypothetical protein
MGKGKRKTLLDIEKEWKEYVEKHPEVQEKQEKNLKDMELLSTLAKGSSPKEKKSDYEC